MSSADKAPMTPKKPPQPATEGPSSSPSLPASHAPTRCQALTRAGKPCGATPMRGEAWCYQHHPDYAEQAQADRIRAAHTPKAPRVKQAPPPAAYGALQTPEDIRKVVEGTIGSLLRGQIDRGRANAILYGCQVALRAVDVAAFERRLKALEGEQAAGQKRRGKAR